MAENERLIFSRSSFLRGNFFAPEVLNEKEIQR